MKLKKVGQTKLREYFYLGVSSLSAFQNLLIVGKKTMNWTMFSFIYEEVTKNKLNHHFLPVLMRVFVHDLQAQAPSLPPPPPPCQYKGRGKDTWKCGECKLASYKTVNSTYAGSVHVLLLCCTPPPQECVHEVKSDHLLQPPSIRARPLSSHIPLMHHWSKGKKGIFIFIFK